MRHRIRGVTLVELMTVMVVLGIIAAIAVPSYRRYLIRAQRSDAKTALLQVQAAQERHFLQANAYTENVTGKPPNGLGLTAESTNGFYAIEVDSDGTTYVATAKPIAGRGQADDKECTEFSIDETGRRGAKGSGGVEACWR